jgi:hypothetical protein
MGFLSGGYGRGTRGNKGYAMNFSSACVTRRTPARRSAQKYLNWVLASCLRIPTTKGTTEKIVDKGIREVISLEFSCRFRKESLAGGSL